MKLKDKVAIITGSSRGIGKATALLFTKEGAKVVINCKQDVTRGQQVVDEITRSGGKAILVQADISKEEDVKELFQRAVAEFKTVDILVNNAGIVEEKDLLDLTVGDWEKTLRTNLIGPFLCSQEAAKIMLAKKGGRIVNVSSIRALEHCARDAVMDYSASKAALTNMTKSMARRLAPNITVNAVLPGWTLTEMNQDLDEDFREQMVRITPIKRFVEPEEVAEAILYLVTADAVTGETLVVDGGINLNSG